MSYSRKLKTIMFSVGEQNVTISDTEDRMAATEAYNEYLRGGFIKYHPEDAPEGMDAVINASLIVSIGVSESVATMDKGDDDFCNVDCDCGGGGGEDVTVTFDNKSSYAIYVNFNGEETFTVQGGEKKSFKTPVDNYCSITSENYSVTTIASDDYRIDWNLSQKKWMFQAKKDGTVNITSGK